MTTKPTDPQDEDGDWEYELEPPDEHVVEQAKQAARRELAAAEHKIDVDAVYRQIENRDDLGGAFDKIGERLRAGFGVKHLLIAITAIGVLLGLGTSGFFTGHLFAGLIVLSLVGLGAANLWLQWSDAQRREAAIRERARELARARGDAVPDEPPPPSFNPFEAVRDAIKQRKFTLRDLLLATTFAAVLLTLVRLLGSMSAAAAVMGAIAILGMVLHAIDYTAPRALVLAWWFAIAGYCVLTALNVAMGLLG
jgi:F0F1-type ATP synthase assembly protein I